MMQGSRLQPGIMAHAVSDVFEHIERSPDREFLLRMSYFEVFCGIFEIFL